MLTINFFASLREQLGTNTLELELPGNVSTVAQLSEYLVSVKGDSWQVLGDSSQVLVAVDQDIAKADTSISNAREVAYFPPMTGG